MCLIITNSASYLYQLLFKLFFTVTQPDQSSVNISLFLSLVCVRAHKSKADACPLRSSAQQVDSEDGASLSLSLTRPLVEETPRGAREKERECVGETERWTDDSKRRWKWEKCSLRPYTSNSGRIFWIFLILSSLFHPNVVGVTSREGGVTGIIKTSDTPTSTRTLRHAWTHGGRCLQLWPFGLHWAE